MLEKIWLENNQHFIIKSMQYGGGDVMRRSINAKFC